MSADRRQLFAPGEPHEADPSRPRPGSRRTRSGPAPVHPGPRAGPATASAAVSATTPTDADNAVAIAKILADPASGKAVIREANKALDGTAADRAAFLATGLRLARAEDDRVSVATILARPGISDAQRAAANKAMDGTPEELRYFVTVGQYQY
ncbi:ALF repeat-containing protein [Streptomyces sp. NPDC059443]|uniref:ALF repeat-containing protein n=1 Tax=unclassified Streptomyces TaxID=2593676 RepID=UPI0036AE0FAA